MPTHPAYCRSARNEVLYSARPGNYSTFTSHVDLVFDLKIKVGKCSFRCLSVVLGVYYRKVEHSLFDVEVKFTVNVYAVKLDPINEMS